MVFKDLSVTKAFDLLLGKVFKELMKISDDYLSIIDSKVNKGDLDPTKAKNASKVIYQALTYVEIFGQLLDYLCFDSYKFEYIIEQFSHQRSLLKILMSLLMDYTKVKSL
jgi:hypothetical protein